MNYKNIKIGDTVLIGGDSGFCTDYESIITDIKIKYNEDTGAPYKVVLFGDSAFSTIDGHAINNGTAYYMKRKINK